MWQIGSHVEFQPSAAVWTKVQWPESGESREVWVWAAQDAWSVDLHLHSFGQRGTSNINSPRWGRPLWVGCQTFGDVFSPPIFDHEMILCKWMILNFNKFRKRYPCVISTSHNFSIKKKELCINVDQFIHKMWQFAFNSFTIAVILEPKLPLLHSFHPTLIMLTGICSSDTVLVCRDKLCMFHCSFILTSSSSYWK